MAAYDFCLYAGPVALDNVVRQLTILNGGLDVGVYLSNSWGFSHICSLFRAHLCWGGGGGGGSVANMGLVLLCRRGLYIYALELCYVGMSWADVLSVMLVRGVMCDVSVKKRPSDWRRAADISAARTERDLVPRGVRPRFLN